MNKEQPSNQNPIGHKSISTRENKLPPKAKKNTETRHRIGMNTMRTMTETTNEIKEALIENPCKNTITKPPSTQIHE